MVCNGKSCFTTITPLKNVVLRFSLEGLGLYGDGWTQSQLVSPTAFGGAKQGERIIFFVGGGGLKHNQDFFYAFCVG